MHKQEKETDDSNTDPAKNKTLSKKGLYAPLSVYGRDDVNVINVNDDLATAASKAKARKLPSSLKDGALIDFLFQVGKEHNRKALMSVGKNNGCKPVSQNEVNDRIRMRALTLIGGGINTSISGSGDQKRKRVSASVLLPPQQQQYCNMSNRKRKQICGKTKYVHKVAGRAGTDSTTRMHSTWDTLEEVNSKWNDYVRRFLKDEGVDLKSMSNSMSANRSLTNTLSRIMSRVELVGSFVEIVRCESHPHLVSTEGFLIGETSQTWRLATLPRKVEKDKPKPKPEKRICKVLTVPKGGGTEFELVLNPRSNDESTKPLTVHIAIRIK